MIPILRVPETILRQLKDFRDLFCRDRGFRHVGRYITNLLLNPNKTLQGGYYNQIFSQEDKASRRAMHEAVFNSNWDQDGVLPRQREVISKDHQGQHGIDVISLDWTFAHHDKGPCIYGNAKGYDYVKGRFSLVQTLLTATVINQKYIDGIGIELQMPSQMKEEKIYLENSCQDEYSDKDSAMKRLLELLHYQKHNLQHKKKSQIFIEMVKDIEEEGKFPKANYSFDNGVLSIPLTRYIQDQGKHWVSELEVNRHIHYKGEWMRIDSVAKILKKENPENFRRVEFKTRTEKKKVVWVYTKSVRLKSGYGKKRILIVHEKEDLSDLPRFLITDALIWDPIRILKTWNYRWPCEIFHEFAKQDTGLESAQVRKEKSVKRHFRLSCVAQSILQRIKSPVAKCEKFMFAKGESTVGQKTRVIAREVFRQSIEETEILLKEGKTIDEIVGILMPI